MVEGIIEQTWRTALPRPGWRQGTQRLEHLDQITLLAMGVGHDKKPENALLQGFAHGLATSLQQVYATLKFCHFIGDFGQRFIKALANTLQFSLLKSALVQERFLLLGGQV